jgi:hypothetical protein
MPGLVPGIHVLSPREKKDVDGRDKPGHDEKNQRAARKHRAALSFSIVIARSEATKQSISQLVALWIASLRSQ